ncbi:MAG: serine hydrolase domain-containing protein, partial [Phycisphaerales bacterium JB038]
MAQHRLAWLLVIGGGCGALLASAASGQPDPTPTTATTRAQVAAQPDADQDGLPDGRDACPEVQYAAGFDWLACDEMDLDPDNDLLPECRARERVARLLITDQSFLTNIAFAVVKEGEVYFADAFEYIGGGQFVHDPGGVDRLYRIGSTTKSVVAVAAKVMEERGELSFDDFVNDDDGGQLLGDGERTLRQLLSHQGAFSIDAGALHLFCYDGNLGEFWVDPDDLVSPHFDSGAYGNLGGGFEYSAFDYSLAGAYLVHRSGKTFEEVLQMRVFDRAQMCTAMLDGARAVGTEIGSDWAVSEQAGVMDVGPYINLVSQTDERCLDNYYSSDDLPGDGYAWLFYHLDEAGAEARDPAGGVIASVIDMANFAAALLGSYHEPDGLLSQAGVRELWGGRSDLGCHPNCPYARYYGIGFFTETLPGEPVTQVEHGGARAGYRSGFVLRPEANLAVCILANA